MNCQPPVGVWHRSFGYCKAIRLRIISIAMNPQTAVVALIALGWSESRIAKEVGTSQPTVHRIKHGLQRRGVSFETAKAVIDLAEAEGSAAANGVRPCGS